MAHWEQLELVRRVRDAYPEFFQGTRVLEVGSGEIVGSVRAFFEDCEYLGVDVTPGPGVDLACPGQEVDRPTGAFDVVVSCECFEHNPYWRESFINMLRMLRPGGLCIVSSAMTGRQEHGTQRMDPGATLAEEPDYVEYYHNLRPRDLLRAVDPALHFEAWVNHPNIYRKDLYFVALKRGAEAEHLARFDRLAEQVRSVREERPLTVGKALRRWLDYLLKRGFVGVFGEQAFHDLKFGLRHGGQRLIIALVGEERVARYRDERRQRKGRGRRARDR
ncbi:MAG: class I SAM-dependent methyltransferase [Pseudomonadota bacterium]